MNTIEVKTEEYILLCQLPTACIELIRASTGDVLDSYELEIKQILKVLEAIAPHP